MKTIQLPQAIISVSESQYITTPKRGFSTLKETERRSDERTNRHPLEVLSCTYHSPLAVSSGEKSEYLVLHWFYIAHVCGKLELKSIEFFTENFFKKVFKILIFYIAEGWQ